MKRGLDNEAIIVTYHNNSLTAGAVWHIMREREKTVKICEEVCFIPHTLRHMYDSMQLKNGLDISHCH